MKINTAIFLMLTGLLSSCMTNKAAFPGTAFERYERTEESGFDQTELNKVSTFIKKNSPTTGLVVLHKGKVVYEYGDTKKSAISPPAGKVY